ncbi:hypothetical protein H7X87_01260 [Acetobacteraceae bacterium]|nr:hypothetical protein [Candidatus Parcubacteria bacterium]
MRRFPSPGRLERLLWNTRRRARAILSDFGPEKPSWENLARALLHDSRPNKAAIMAVAAQLGCHYGRKATYRAAREWLTERRSALFPHMDTTDGVTVRIAAAPVYTKLGVEVFRALQVGEYGQRELLWFVRKGKRTFHCEEYQAGSYVDGIWVTSPKAAVRIAIEAWQKQDELAAEEARLAAEAREHHSGLAMFLDGTELGFCPLIDRQDSYAAGNCHAGTEGWVMEHGWRARVFLPGFKLIPYLGDERVRRVVMAARRRRVDQTEAVAA